MRLSERIIRNIENTPIRDMKGRILGPNSYKLAKQVERLRREVSTLKAEKANTCRHGNTWFPGCCEGVK